MAQCCGLSAVSSQLTRLVRNRIAAGILVRPAQHEGASPVAEVTVRQVGAMAAQAVETVGQVVGWLPVGMTSCQLADVHGGSCRNVHMQGLLSAAPATAKQCTAHAVLSAAAGAAIHCRQVSPEGGVGTAAQEVDLTPAMRLLSDSIDTGCL